MPTFIYRAKNEKGQIVSGTIEAENEKVASQTLWEAKLKVITLEVQPVLPGFSFLKVGVKDRAIFARQLSTMIDAGIHLVQALKVCQTQTKNKKLKEALEAIIHDLEEGYSFSNALSKHPDIFDKIFISLVKSGEASGTLSKVLLDLADRLEKDAAFRGKVKSAFVYPAFVFIVLLGIGTLMMIKVIPTLKDIFQASNLELPITTRILIGTSNFLVSFWWTVLLFLALLVFFFRFYLRTEKGRSFWSQFVIKVPVFGDLNKAILMTRFCRTFALLVSSGIPLLDALYIVADVMDIDLYKKSLYNIATDVEKGVPLSTLLSQDRYFPSIIGQMAAIGEQTGRLDEIFNRLGIFYENEVEDRTKNISALLEPIVIAILGLGVGILVSAILIPIYQISLAQ